MQISFFKVSYNFKHNSTQIRATPTNVKVITIYDEGAEDGEF